MPVLCHLYEIFRLTSGLADVAPKNMANVLVKLLVSHKLVSGLAALALRNMLCMVVTLETSQFVVSGLARNAKRNILARLVTLDKSGTSPAETVMFIAPLNAAPILVHLPVPHCTMSLSFQWSPVLL